MVVDSDESTRRLAADALEAVGYKVLQAANGKEAHRLVLAGKTHLVVTELVMPESDGLELIRQLRKSEPDIKLVAMSGSSRADTYLAVARVLGADAAIHKPLQMQQFLHTIQQVLAQRAEL